MPYWKPIKKDTLSTKKEKDSDIKYDRVTEVLSAHPKEGCERMAWSAKNEKSILYQTGTLAGTVVHWKIEKYVAEKYEGFTPPPPLEEDLDEAELELYLREIAKEDEIVQGRLIKRQKIIPKISHAYGNFIDFMTDPSSVWNRYEIIPLYIEKRVWSEKHQYGGTVDLVGIANIQGTKQIVIVDWKSGRKALKQHNWQLAAYYRAFIEMVDLGRIQIPDLPISKTAWCIKFGGATYDELAVNASLQSYEDEFFRAKEVFDTVTDNPRGWCILCMFCSFGYDCNR